MTFVRVVLVSSVFALVAFVAAAQQSTPPNPVTEISADLGACSADFHVTSMDGKGIYNAKIHTTIRHGFMSKRKIDLDAGTNSDGRARFVKLPGEAKRPIEFTITKGTDTATRSYDPATDCHAKYDVPLKTK